MTHAFTPTSHALLVASGDLRLAANRACWPAQEAMERPLTAAFAAQGVRLERAHPYDEKTGHGFISSQRMGMDIFQGVPKDVPVVVAEAVWQYSHHVLSGLRDHRAPILTVANWSGEWPGLVGMLNLNGSLTKAGVHYSSLWSEGFTDDFFLQGLRQWVRSGEIDYDTEHLRPLNLGALATEGVELAYTLSERLKAEKAILGVFDEGCMGMYNAIIDDELLNPLGIYKERLSQSALVAEMRRVTIAEAGEVRRWLGDRGVVFVTGSDEKTELTDAQLAEQCKMYVAAVRLAHAFGCDALGIQYQQGLKDMTPASDLVEGLLNNPERPPVYPPEVYPVDATLEADASEATSSAATSSELYAGLALPHFNEVDECAAVDALVTNRVWTALGFDPSTTLHDLRWGEHYQGNGIDAYVWVFQISGAAPASHFVGGYAGARSERQPPMYFPLGGGTLKGVSKPGEIVWSRVFVQGGSLHVDLGRAAVVELPPAETERRWQATTPQWPIMHAVLRGVSRDQMMARHKANHVQVAYAPSAEAADRALEVKAAMFAHLGLGVNLCGVHGDAVKTTEEVSCA